MCPAFFNEYQSRAEYYDEWLRKNLGDGKLPASPEQRHKLLIEKRSEAYQQLCDIVYEKKGFTKEGIPRRETAEKFALMDEQARKLFDELGM